MLDATPTNVSADRVPATDGPPLDEEETASLSTLPNEILLLIFVATPFSSSELMLISTCHKWRRLLTRPISDGPNIIGRAPRARRPSWLPTKGDHRARAVCWSLSAEQIIFFMRSCVATRTWATLKTVKGEDAITMHDVSEHFVIPWTQGTGGCSIALLMNVGAALPAERVLVHSPDGSAVETYNCVQNVVNHAGVPPEARLFFSTFSMFQPVSGGSSGFSTCPQPERDPIAAILSLSPKHGVYVVHTTKADVCSDLWVVNAICEAIAKEVPIHGVLDFYACKSALSDHVAALWPSALAALSISDRAPSESKARQGFDRLDVAIADVHAKMAAQFAELAAKNGTRQEDDFARCNLGNSTTTCFDWRKYWGGDNAWDGCSRAWQLSSVEWKFQDKWVMSMARMRRCYHIPEPEGWDGFEYGRHNRGGSHVRRNAPAPVPSLPARFAAGSAVRDAPARASWRARRGAVAASTSGGVGGNGPRAGARVSAGRQRQAGWLDWLGAGSSKTS